ncbi:E3 ubiquitin-protein ligase ZNF598-like isoform X1 [Triticum dicoccoides]|uniref:E3 ubiquitin-protein ligase ZNF598-like isoform X1 n=1 Tax=Triticum dicoccoides TaxID=85692 RepID=UPI00188F53D9|nr:E3 ubiquitin-protein ligase ZNF598-like isoform X1 [Triticum dicoccoides]
MDDACAVCAERLEWVAYGACGHREVCSACVTRLRFVLRDQRCCLCMTHCPAVFATKEMGDRTKAIGDLSALPAAAGEGKTGDYWYHEATQVWFDDADHYRMVRAICRISCTVCESSGNKGKKGSKSSKAKHKIKFETIEQLKAHLSNKHCLYMCDLCLDGRKVFICEQKLYTRPQLNQHIKTGDSEVDGSEVERRGFAGHPMCKFCRSPFYGETELDTHLTREHYSCHICQRQHGGQDDYFRNYDDLEQKWYGAPKVRLCMHLNGRRVYICSTRTCHLHARPLQACEMHFRRDHFFCEDRECLEKKFIVFQSEAELKRHNAVEHRKRMPHAQKNSALQTPTSSRDRSELEQSNGRGRRHNACLPNGSVDNTLLSVQNGIANMGRGSGNQVAAVVSPLRSSSGHSSQAGQSSGMNRVWQQPHFPPLSRQEVPDARIGSCFQELPSPPISGQSGYTPFASRSSRTAARAMDLEFPPLSGSNNRTAASTEQGVRKVAENTHAFGLRQQSNGIVNTHHSAQHWSLKNTDLIPSGSSHSPSWPTPNTSPHVSGSLSLTSAGNGRQETPVSRQVLCSVDDVRAANNSLVERMQAALGMDRDRYSMFKEISGEYRQGVINASKYLSYVEQFGLSHLVLEMSRLLPDPQKQKELADAYYANLRLTSLQGNGGGGAVCSKESTRKNKGKGKLPAAAQDLLEDKLLSAASKLQSQVGGSRAPLREGCGAADGPLQEPRWPVKGAWQNRGGQRLVSKAKK